MKKYVTLLLLSAAFAARAQVKIAIEGQAYTISSTTNASIANATSIAIQWYRNDVAIPACTAQTCVVPATLATGDNVRFVRKVIGTGCTGDSEGFSNEVVVTFKCGGGHGTRIGTVCWADRNVAAAGAFAATPSVYGLLYQWNRNKGWPTSGAVAGWVTVITDASWTVNPNPCPTGWGVPSQPQLQALIDAGSTWVNSGTRGATSNGRFYGPNHATCTLPSSMSGCLFLPAAGRRNNLGALIEQGLNGAYRSATSTGSETAYNLAFSSTDGSFGNANKAAAMSLRCVLK